MKKASTKSIKNSTNHRILISIALIVGIVVIGSFIQTQKSQKYTNTANSEMSSLNKIYSRVEKVFGGNIPWDVLTNRESHQLYPKRINGLIPFMGEISENYDNRYEPITTFNLTKSETIPLKNAYLAYYEVPDVLKNEFGLKLTESPFVLSLSVYEFDREPTERELSTIKKGTIVNCVNEKSKVRLDSMVNSQMVIHSCNLNPTDDQKKQLEGSGLYDQGYVVYLIDRHILFQLSILSTYIPNPDEYFESYLTTIFNSNDELFMSSDTIRSVDKARKFREKINEQLKQ